MSSVQDVLDRYAEGTPYDDLADAFRSLERWTGDDPRLLLAEAAASTTGQNYRTGVKPAVERFRDAFVETDRIGTFADLAALPPTDDDLVAIFGAKRTRRVLLEAARVFADRPEDDDLASLQAWASEADVYHYRANPIGSIAGVGPVSFQYLRMLAGIDTAKPDPHTIRFLDELAIEIDWTEFETDTDPSLDVSDPLHVVASCEWLAMHSSYTMLEIDQLAWWTFADEAERDAGLAALS